MAFRPKPLEVNNSGCISALVAFIAHPGFKCCTTLKLSLALTAGKTNGGEEKEYINLYSFKNSILDLTLLMKVACGTSQMVYLLTCTKVYGFRTVIYLVT